MIKILMLLLHGLFGATLVGVMSLNKNYEAKQIALGLFVLEVVTFLYILFK